MSDIYCISKLYTYCVSDSLAVVDAFFGESSRILFSVSDPICSGDESELLDCLHDNPGRCTASTVAGVICPTGDTMCTY